MSSLSFRHCVRATAMFHRCVSFGVSLRTSPGTPAPPVLSASRFPSDPPPTTLPTTSLPQRRRCRHPPTLATGSHPSTRAAPMFHRCCPATWTGRPAPLRSHFHRGLDDQPPPQNIGRTICAARDVSVHRSRFSGRLLTAGSGQRTAAACRARRTSTDNRVATRWEDLLDRELEAPIRGPTSASAAGAERDLLNVLLLPSRAWAAGRRR
jgi:hypothetical protein